MNCFIGLVYSSTNVQSLLVSPCSLDGPGGEKQGFCHYLFGEVRLEQIGNTFNKKDTPENIGQIQKHILVSLFFYFLMFINPRFKF